MDSWMVLPACAGLVSLRRSTVGDATPFAGLASGTLTSSYTSGAMSLYVLEVPSASADRLVRLARERGASRRRSASRSTRARRVQSPVRCDAGMDVSSAASRDARERASRWRDDDVGSALVPATCTTRGGARRRRRARRTCSSRGRGCERWVLNDAWIERDREDRFYARSRVGLLPGSESIWSGYDN